MIDRCNKWHPPDLATQEIGGLQLKIRALYPDASLEFAAFLAYDVFHCFSPEEVGLAPKWANTRNLGGISARKNFCIGILRRKFVHGILHVFLIK